MIEKNRQTVERGFPATATIESNYRDENGELRNYERKRLQDMEPGTMFVTGELARNFRRGARNGEDQYMTIDVAGKHMDCLFMAYQKETEEGEEAKMEAAPIRRVFNMRTGKFEEFCLMKVGRPLRKRWVRAQLNEQGGLTPFRYDNKGSRIPVELDRSGEPIEPTIQETFDPQTTAENMSEDDNDVARSLLGRIRQTFKGLGNAARQRVEDEGGLKAMAEKAVDTASTQAEALSQELKDRIEEAGGLEALAKKAITTGEGALDAIKALAQKNGISEDEARDLLDGLNNRAQEMAVNAGISIEQALDRVMKQE